MSEVIMISAVSRTLLGAALLGLVGSAAVALAQHQSQGTTPPTATQSGAGPRKITMEELHRSGGVPPGWKFALPGGDAARGRQVFVDLECYKCHAVKGENFPASGGDAKNVGPELTGMGSHHPAEYFAESNPAPHAVIPHGPGHTGPDGTSIMPSYAESLSVTQLVDLVAFVRSLTSGGHTHGAAPAEKSTDIYTVRLSYHGGDHAGHEGHGGHAGHGAAA